MKIWTNNEFQGFWPVGTAAVVIAPTPEQAADYLNLFLAELCLEDSTPEQFKEMEFEDGQVQILCDGNY